MACLSSVFAFLWYRVIILIVFYWIILPVKLFSIIITLPRRKIHSHFVPRRITIKSKTVFQSLFCLEPHNVLKYQVTGCCLISVHDNDSNNYFISKPMAIVM